MVDVVKLLEPVTRIRQRRTGPLILELDLTEGIVDDVPGDPLGQVLAMRQTRLSDILEGLRRAAGDNRVKGLVAKIGGRHIGLAKVQELRAAVGEFRDAGKSTVAWSESFGDMAPGTVPYYLASAFEEIAVQPSASIGLTGLSVTNSFYRDALDKLGVEFENGARHEYKSAINTFTERGYTEPQREATSRLVESFTEQIVDGIATGRGLSTEGVRGLFDRGPFLAQEALAAELVDRIAYRDEVYGELCRRHNPASANGKANGNGSGQPHLQFVSRYQRMQSLMNRVPAMPGTDYVALISAQGMITSGRSSRHPLGGGSAMGSDTISAALRAARADTHARAVVLRVDSGGGSYVASDAIWREVNLTREAGTPVVATMGDVAASGGYFIAMGADVVIAEPGTLTGSIGVFMGKPVLKQLLDRIGVSVDSIEGGAHSRMFATDRKFTDSEWERVNAILDHIYDDFTSKAAQSRQMTPERIHELARGRVWTGKDAHAHGLVDELGGLETAGRIARERAGLAHYAPLRHFPRPNPLDRLVPAESSEDRSAARTAVRWGAWGPLAEVAARIGLPESGPLVLPGTWEIR